MMTSDERRLLATAAQEARAERDAEWLAAIDADLDTLSEVEADHERGRDYDTGWIDGVKEVLYRLKARMTGAAKLT